MSFDNLLAVWLHEQSGLLPLAKVVSLVQHAADTLQTLHNQRIVHQDVNPNSFRIQIDDSDQFKLQLTDQGSSTRVLALFGRSFPANSQPLYMAPEQWTGQTTPATDQYALAVLTYQLLTGQAPFQGPPAQLMDAHFNVRPPLPSTFNPQVTSAIDTVILNALSKRPEDRFPSILAFAHALEVAVYHPEALIVSVPRMPVEGGLHATLYVSDAEADSGTLRTITLPDGRHITVPIPKKSKNGQTIRLEGLGDTGAGGSISTAVLTIAVSPTEARPSGALPAKQNTNSQQAPAQTSPAEPLLATEESSANITPNLTPDNATPNLMAANATPNLMAANITPNLMIANVTPQLPPIQIERSKVTRPITAYLTSTLNQSRTLATRAYTTITLLPPPRRIAFLTCVALAIILIGVSIFSFILAHARVSIAYAANGGTPALSDSLRNNGGGNNWPESVGKDGSFCQFTQGTYHVGISQTGASHYCVAGATGYSDFAYEARMKILRGDQGGLIFRADGASSKFYYFRIGRDGSYGLYLYTDTTGAHARTLAKGVTPALYTGLNIANLIAVAAHGNTIELYANNQQITTVTNDTYGSGQIGLAAAYTTEATDVVFSDVKVWTL